MSIIHYIFYNSVVSHKDIQAQEIFHFILENCFPYLYNKQQITVIALGNCPQQCKEHDIKCMYLHLIELQETLATQIKEECSGKSYLRRGYRFCGQE